MLLIYYIIIISIIINIYINTKLKYFFFKKNIFFKNLNGYYYSVVYCLLFIFIFIFVIRFLRIFTSKTKYIDLNIYSQFFISFLHNNGLVYSIVCCLIVILLLVQFRKLVITFTKFNFLRVFYIHRTFFVPGVYKIKDFQKNLLNLIPKNFQKILIFGIRNFFKFLMVLFFIYAIVFNQGIMYIKFLPWYGLYYFIFNLIDNLNKLDWEFDLVTSNIYKGLSFTNDCFFKIKEYHTYLIIGYSEFFFVNSIDMLLTKPLGNVITLKKDVDYFLI